MIELISDTIIEFEKDINSNNFVVDSLKTKVDDSASHPSRRKLSKTILEIAVPKL